MRITDQIDWEALHQIYKFYNWRWTATWTRTHVPTARELKLCVEDLVASLRNLDQPKSQCGTGRLTVFRVDDIVKVWVGCTQNKKNLEPGFWAHKAVEKLTELHSA